MGVDVLDLVAPIHADRPCGENLEETQVMASFDAYQLFGQPIALDPPPPWDEIKQRALEALASTKDVRVLAHLAAALLRTDGLAAFFETLTVASRWLETYWTEVFPLVDEDAIVRRNALSAFADQAAVLEGLRRAVMVSSRQHGRFSLRDVDIASGNAKPAEGEEPPDPARIDAAFATVPVADLASLQQRVLDATSALKSIDARMRAQAGSDAAPSFDRLLGQLGLMEGVLRSRVAAHPDTVDTGTQNAATGSGASAPMAVGAVKSRQDAIRAMEEVAAFFRQTEPSSPIPMLLERATRLVSKNFLEVLADVAPDGVAQARAAGGLRNE
jgi:type VI secretion system protein ImpA